MPGERSSLFPLGAAVTVAGLEGDPHPVLRGLRAREPVSWLPALGGWLVTRHDLALAVMNDSGAFTVDDPRFSTARVVGPSMLSTDGAEHDRHRDPFSRAFRGAEAVARLETLVTGLAGRLVSALRPGAAGRAELRRGLAGPLAVAVVADILGLSGTEPAVILTWYDAIVGAVTELSAQPGAQAPGSAGGAAFASPAGQPAHRGRPAGRPVAAGYRGPRRRPGAGRGGVQRGGADVRRHRDHRGHDQQRGLAPAERPRPAQPGPRRTRRCWPAPWLSRCGWSRPRRWWTGTPPPTCVLGGAGIRRGDLVIVSITAANRDPAVFPDPDRFDIRRRSARHNLGFARGPHFCPGAELARLETRAAISALLAQLPGLRLDPARRRRPAAWSSANPPPCTSVGCPPPPNRPTPAQDSP